MKWFDELPLNPATHPVSMGTQALGGQPWLIADARRETELAEKQWSLEHRRADVSWFTQRSQGPAQAVCELIQQAGTNVAGDAAHPLETAATAVQEDLCLMHRRDGLWYLDASVVCFPTHWHLPSKVGRPIGQVHDPVGGYHERIATKVTRLFDRIGERPVLRRNFGLTEDRELFQPAYRTADPQVSAERVLDELCIRSERQTLRRVEPDWLLFTIRIQMASLGELLTTEQRRDQFRQWVTDVPSHLAPKRHLSDAQRTILLEVLACSRFWPPKPQREQTAPPNV